MSVEIEKWIEIISKLEGCATSAGIVQDSKTIHSLNLQLQVKNVEELNSMREHINDITFETASGQKMGEFRKKLAKEYLMSLEIQLTNRDIFPICCQCKIDKNIRFFKCRHSFCDECGHYGHSYVYCPICKETFFDDSTELSFDHIV
jgi:hypothetical protein